jgi:hypothetical protein
MAFLLRNGFNRDDVSRNLVILRIQRFRLAPLSKTSFVPLVGDLIEEIHIILKAVVRRTANVDEVDRPNRKDSSNSTPA